MAIEDPFFCRSLEDFEVLVDMLDDPLRRWFAADDLYRYLRGKWSVKGLPEVPEHLLTRVVNMLSGGLSPEECSHVDALHLLAKARSDPSVVSRRNSPPAPVWEVRQVWAYGSYVFYSEDAAQAYHDFVESLKERPALKVDGVAEEEPKVDNEGVYGVYL